MLSEHDTLLNGRYRLAKRISINQNEAWLAVDPEGGHVLLKVWPYLGEQPNEAFRALWDRELRNLFRLSSSPDADAKLVVLHDAGIDRGAHCFVMVLSAPGFEPLSKILESRTRYDWIRDIRQADVRVPLWRALREVAQGLGQLHQQQMLHRALSADCILLDPDSGPESMRLGGFEFTVKVGQSDAVPSKGVGLAAPESARRTKHPHTFESDWYQFGVVAAQIFAGVNAPTHDGDSRHLAVLTKVRDASKLSGIERDFLTALLEVKPELRLSRVYEILEAIDEIIARLDEPVRLVEGSYLALAVLLGPQKRLTDAICDLDESISALDTEGQRLFIENDLKTPRLIARSGGTYLLQGNRLVYNLREYAEIGSQPSGQWGIAFSVGPDEIRYSGGSDFEVEIRRIPVRVFRVADIRTDLSIVKMRAVSWRPFLPRGAKSFANKERQERFHEFFRITNQVELLLRDAEIFPYRCIKYAYENGKQELVISPRDRPRSVPAFAEVPGGMMGFLVLQRAQNQYGDKVYLGLEESVHLNRKVDLPEFWTILEIDEDLGHVTLQRTGPKLPKPPNEGYIRSFDMFGQISLIRRRKRAIDRLRNHNYLLKALRSPSSVYIDTGDQELPIAIDRGKVDDAKFDALRNIWRTRPIFALQGPPGTGKTTLVANLLGQIFADDRVAQVLVTAQAHSAVDVLRDKVSNDIFSDSDEGQRPLAVRLSKPSDQSQSDPDSVRMVTLRILDRAAEALNGAQSAIEVEWLAEVEQARLALRRQSIEGGAADLCELVKRSANIVYSTTTAGDLEELADLTQSFDWSLIEEAGKAHGFDLVLPLQTGHRWVLIGDQKQLPPYRYNDFRKSLEALEQTVLALLSLPERAGGLVDVDLLQTLRDMDELERAQRRDYWLSWLPLFGNLHRTCTEAIPAVPNGGNGHGMLASMLYQQHRMHPVISGLISTAYYDRPIESLTVDEAGRPLERVVHPFVRPPALRNAQIVWIDVGWHAKDTGSQTRDDTETSAVEVAAISRFLRTLETVPAFGKKLRVAVLSPYRRQVFKLSEALKQTYSTSSPTWLAPLKANEFAASTVDSFQGSQADVVVVSLVRQNDKRAGEGLGFLGEAARMNVLFSRAERMLVLVGSWEFFKFQVRDAPRDRNQPLGHWRLATEYLEACMANGSGCLISDTELIPLATL